MKINPSILAALGRNQNDVMVADDSLKSFCEGTVMEDSSYFVIFLEQIPNGALMKFKKISKKNVVIGILVSSPKMTHRLLHLCTTTGAVVKSKSLKIFFFS